MPCGHGRRLDSAKGIVFCSVLLLPGVLQQVLLPGQAASNGFCFPGLFELAKHPLLDLCKQVPLCSLKGLQVSCIKVSPSFVGPCIVHSASVCLVFAARSHALLFSSFCPSIWLSLLQRGGLAEWRSANCCSPFVVICVYFIT